MACGRPVISTRNGGIEQGWKDDFGLLVDVDDIDALAKAMQEMRHSRDKYDFENISSQTLKLYSPEVVSNEISKALERVVLEGSRSIS